MAPAEGPLFPALLRAKLYHKELICEFDVLDMKCYGSLPQYSLVNEPLIELVNPGASGSLFYLTSDDEFIIKTVQHKEAKFLQRLLPGYYMVRSLMLLHYSS